MREVAPKKINQTWIDVAHGLPFGLNPQHCQPSRPNSAQPTPWASPAAHSIKDLQALPQTVPEINPYLVRFTSKGTHWAKASGPSGWTPLRAIPARLLRADLSDVSVLTKISAAWLSLYHARHPAKTQAQTVICAIQPIGAARNPSAKNKSVLRGATMKGVRGAIVMDCAVEAKAQQCGLQPKGSASDRCCRVWKSSRDGEPEGT